MMKEATERRLGEKWEVPFTPDGSYGSKGMVVKYGRASWINTQTTAYSYDHM